MGQAVTDAMMSQEHRRPVMTASLASPRVGVEAT